MGDLPSLKAAVAQAERDGELGERRARDVAGAVLSRELVSLRGPDEQFPDVAPCSRQVQPALEEVARGGGEFAAPAAIALIDAGLDAPSADGSSARIAVLAREAEGPSLGPSRRQYMLSGDALVRRAALAAAKDSVDARDTAALLEAARLDPDPEARKLAVRALGVIGGADVVIGLVDVWQTASEALRREILSAWARPASFGAGGEEQLVNVVEDGTGTLQVAAALELERLAAGPPALSTQILLGALQGDDSPARRLALVAVPWSSPELRSAVVERARSGDAATQILASLRLAEHGALGAEDAARVAKLAETSAGGQAMLARAVLARAGNSSARPGLRADLAAPKADQRALAAFALMSLGDWPGAAQALGDDSPGVRRAVACQMLAGAAPEHDEQGSAPSRPFGPMAPELLALLDAAEAQAAPRSDKAGKRPNEPGRKPRR